jgi:hypothetical protein
MTAAPKIDQFYIETASLRRMTSTPSQWEWVATCLCRQPKPSDGLEPSTPSLP